MGERGDRTKPEPDEKAGKESATGKLGEAFQSTLKETGQFIDRQRMLLAQGRETLAKEILPVFLETMQLPGAGKKTYDISVDLDDEVTRKFHDPRDVGNPASLQRAIENYKLMRTAEMEHRDLSTVLDKAQRAELAAWMLFPENDDQCKAGRTATEELIGKLIDRGNKQPTDKELADEDHLKARIASLLVNEHDYLGNPEEIDHPEGMRHLPANFKAPLGPNGEEKEYDVRQLYEDHMFAVLQGTKQSPLKPDERAVVAFHLQTLARVLPGELLDAAHKAERDGLLQEYTTLYFDRAYSLADVPDIKWQQFREIAAGQLPSTAEVKPGLDLSDAEKLKEELNLADIRQISIEQMEMRWIFENFATTVRDKQRELAYPDHTRLKAYLKYNNPLREYDVMRRLQEQLEITGVLNAQARQYVQIDMNDPNNFRGDFLKRCAAYGDVWQRVYWAKDLSKRQNQTSNEAWSRFPVTYCAESEAGRKMLFDFKGPAGLDRNDEDRLAQLKEQLPCKHEQIKRQKGR